MNIYSVNDAKAAAFLLPFFFKRDEMATRVFSDLINKEDHQFSLHPGDYTLFKLGEFDENNGELTSIVVKSLGNGVEFLESLPTGVQNVKSPIQPGPNR